MTQVRAPEPPLLITTDFTLRPYAFNDKDAVVRVLNDWEVTKWLTMVPWPYQPHDFNWFLQTFIPERQHMVWVIDGGHGLMGAVSVIPELGYWLDPAYHGQGIMTKAATCVIDWYFAQGHDRLTSGYHLGNAPSAAVLRKLGFVDTHRNHAVQTARGDSVDIQRMVLTAEDWQARDG